MSNLKGTPRLVGTTGNLYSDITEARRNSETFNYLEITGRTASSTNDDAQESNFFKSAQWSADGTTLLTSSADDVLRTLILPPNLLSKSTPHALSPYASHILPSPAYALAIYPSYDLSVPNTALYVASPSSLPIRLISPFVPGILASYPLINPTTEAFIAPHSLLFDTYGDNVNQFFAGSESEISIFDINRNGEGPLNRMKTIPSRRKKIVGGGVGMKGIVSALAMSSEGILAAGTFGRWLGFYDSGGRGGTAGVFEVGKPDEDKDTIGDGAGITQLLWSSCGRYLCVIERGSTGIGVWDIRSTGKRVCWLRGRKAKTMQRLSVDVVGSELWSGGTDGIVRVWEGLGHHEGLVDTVYEFRAHEDAVSSAVVHPSGTVLATCSGQRHDDDRVDDALGSDNSLKVWALEQDLGSPKHEHIV
ncbi:hypothetical protein MMC11_003054 [Xylographa trunciseda]|nr:hypothetical protein [Xylographa trunciseda]